MKRARSTRALWLTQTTIHWREAEFRGIIGSTVEESASKCRQTMNPHTARASTRVLRDAGITSFISEADRTQLDPSDCHSLMEHGQRGLDEPSAVAHSASKVLGDLSSGRFAALASTHACRAPSDVVHRQRGSASHSSCFCAKEVAVNFTAFASHVTSHHSPHCPESVCDALEFDLTRADSVDEARSIRPTLLSEPSLPEVGPPAPPPAFPPDHVPFDDEDTVSMETSEPRDTEDTVSLLIEAAEVDPPGHHSEQRSRAWIV